MGTEGVSVVDEVMFQPSNNDPTEEVHSSDSNAISASRPTRSLDDSSEGANNDADSGPASTCRELQLLGAESLFTTFFVDESLTCGSPVERHLYDILPASMNRSLPCYYCGETDLLRTKVIEENTYPICSYCRTVKKYGSVQKRKKRTITARKKSPKIEKQKNSTVNVESEESSPEVGDPNVVRVLDDEDDIPL